MTRAERRRLIREKAKELMKTKLSNVGLTRHQRRIISWEMAKSEIR